jgi:hypothetical protein
MSTRARRALAGTTLALLIGTATVLGVSARGTESRVALPIVQDAQTDPSAPFTFGLWGDMPYAKAGDAPKLPALAKDMNAAGLAFSIFDGDIKDGSSRCDDSVFAEAIQFFNTFEAPMIYVPGDNEWTDCHRTNNGGFSNLERLSYMRRTMFASPESFGQRKLTLEHQGPIGGEYVENTRWSYNSVVFVGLNVPGSNNNKVSSASECTGSSARTPADCDADNAEYAARDAANITWLRQSFQLAKQRNAAGLMLVIQADPGFDVPETETVNERDSADRDGYTAFLAALAEETRAFPGQVVLVHGDTHFFKLDKPLMDATHLLPNFTRLETFGSPNIHWVKVDVNPATRTVFTFWPMMVPGN